ncbi:MAG: heavy metal translocating P-type ATPase [Candidatus Glassbacteria bacterium]
MSEATLLHIEGMDCSEETELIRRGLHGVNGVKSLDFNIIKGTVKVEFERDLIDEEAIRNLIEKTGLRVLTGGKAKESGFWQKRGRHILTAASGVCLMLGWLISLRAGHPLEYIPLFVAGILTGGYYIFLKGWSSIRSKTADINFLMSIAVIGAAIIGEWLEAGVVIFLFSTAQLLETYSLERTRNAIERLMDISPALARVRRGEEEIEISPEEIEPGEVLLIKPGERIPLDGEVLTGTSHVDQSPITGESRVVSKIPGQEVYAGTINREGFLEVRVTRRVSDTTLARIIHLVEEASVTKAPSQNFVDRFAKYYTPIVIMLAITLAVIPPLLFGQPFSDWFYRALVLLVISCPCALVISTPVTIVSALTSAAQSGVLIKGGVYLEDSAVLDTIVFDKTGTLTTGRLSVTEVIPASQSPPAEILTIAASIESLSEHHLARAIVEEARRRELPLREVDAFESIAGKGVRARMDGKSYILGSHRLIEEEGRCNSEADEIMEDHEKHARTTVMLADGNGLLGIIVIADTLRDGSEKALDELRRLGVEDLLMLTGDNEGTARAIAGKLGINHYASGLLPEEKVEKMRELLTSGKKVAFVGDGVNDAPALAVATVGMAMGSSGTDVALETSDIALMSDDLSKIPYTIKLGKKALGVIRENITVALITKLVFFTLAIPGLATLWMAVGADMGASLVVILNGMRLLGKDT